jgi:hypothetical protein
VLNNPPAALSTRSNLAQFLARFCFKIVADPWQSHQLKTCLAILEQGFGCSAVTDLTIQYKKNRFDNPIDEGSMTGASKKIMFL